MLAVEPAVCVFCHYGVEESESKGRVVSRADDRKAAERQARAFNPPRSDFRSRSLQPIGPGAWA